jgi:CO dehydrogenase nickel-insertion accessory protein CooC1
MTKTNANGNGATSVHISLQGKGGVGKSLISAILSQYLLSKGHDVRGIDADPVNQTLAEYRGLTVTRLNLLKEGSVDQREFDLLMEGSMQVRCMAQWRFRGEPPTPSAEIWKR